LPPVYVYGQWKWQHLQQPKNKNGIGCNSSDTIRSKNPNTLRTESERSIKWLFFFFGFFLDVSVDNLGGKNVRTILYANHFQTFGATFLPPAPRSPIKYTKTKTKKVLK